MAENCSSMEPWVYRAAFTDGLWLSDALARDTEMLTRALQVSIASSSSSPDSSSLPPTPTPASFPSMMKYEQPTSDCSDSGSRTAVVLPGPTGKISKRKSRASKRTPTTFITADPANFRQMVQQVTGVRLGDEAVSVPVETMIMRPAPQRAAVGSGSRVVIPQSCLPTLDTSAFLLSRDPPPPPVQSVAQSHHQQNQQILPAVDAGVGQFNFDAAASFQCFPTLESWGVM